MQSDFTWPPPFIIRKSSRSKRISLRISQQYGLEIIVPSRTSEKKALKFLEAKHDWVKKYQHLLTPAIPTTTLPEQIDLKFINEQWKINPAKLKIKEKITVESETYDLNLNDHLTLTDQLYQIKLWLKHKSLQHLGERLDFLSRLHGLPYGKLKVGFQHSRWGSCSKDKNINLNCKLMLLPDPLVDYVIVHELIHTLHFDHSPKFWQAVAKLIPNYKDRIQQLKNLQPQLPAWLYC